VKLPASRKWNTWKGNYYICEEERRIVMTGKKAIDVGARIRDFSLKDQNNQIFNMAAQKGKKVIFSFHPLAWTPVCAQQMQALEKNRRLLERLNTVATGVSVDSVPCKKAWAKSLRISKTPLLADFWPHGALAKALGIFRKEGFSERANIIVNEKGTIIFQKIYPLHELPDLEEIIGQLRMPA
jgi:peroxiredoxin